jgi:hypothetical protein
MRNIDSSRLSADFLPKKPCYEEALLHCGMEHNEANFMHQHVLPGMLGIKPQKGFLKGPVPDLVVIRSSSF